MFKTRNKSQVFSNAFDEDRQNQIISILQKRLQEKRKMSYIVKKLDGQIGGPRRHSPPSSIISTQIWQTLSPEEFRTEVKLPKIGITDEEERELPSFIKKDQNPILKTTEYANLKKESEKITNVAGVIQREQEINSKLRSHQQVSTEETRLFPRKADQQVYDILKHKKEIKMEVVEAIIDEKTRPPTILPAVSPMSGVSAISQQSRYKPSPKGKRQIARLATIDQGQNGNLNLQLPEAIGAQREKTKTSMKQPGHKSLTLQPLQGLNNRSSNATTLDKRKQSRLSKMEESKPDWSKSLRGRSSQKRSSARRGREGTKSSSSEKERQIISYKKRAVILKKKFEMINKLNAIEKAYIDTENVSPEKVRVTQLQFDSDRLNTDAFKKKLMHRVTNDKKVIQLLMIENDGDILQNPSRLFTNLENLGEVTHQTELLEYMKFLTGVRKAKKKMIPNLQLINGSGLVPQKEKDDVDYGAQFETYVDKNQRDMLRDVAQQIEDKVNYINVYRTGNSPGTQLRYSDDPNFAYFQQCSKDNDVVLPLLHYVYKKTLCLQSYTLSIGHCNALARACEFFSTLNINRILFDNCGIDDEEFASILRGLQNLKDFKQIIYRYNVFLGDSLAELKPLLRRRVPHHLEELRIENCKMSPEVTYNLLDSLRSKCFIKSLALVNINLTEESFDLLCQFVEFHTMLEEFDLSWSGILPFQMGKLLRIIARNTRLKELNLSWNQLLDEPLTNEPKSEVNQEFNSFLQNDEEIDTEKIFEEELSEHALEHIELLCRFIQKNRQLLHLDLTSTGMSERQLSFFAKAIRRSQSLRSLHLSGNPGITKRLVEYMMKRAHCVRANNLRSIDFRMMPSERMFQKFDSGSAGNIDPMNQFKGKFRNFLSKQLKITPPPSRPESREEEDSGLSEEQQQKLNVRLNEAARLQVIQKQKRIEQNPTQNVSTNKKTLLLTRKLGHKEDIPGSGQWKIFSEERVGMNDCWYCDRQIYSLIFWNEAIGQVELKNFDPADTEYFKKKLFAILDEKQREGQPVKEGTPKDCPTIYGAFTDWLPMRMMEIREYCELVNVDKPDIFELCKEKEVLPKKYLNLDELSEEQMRLYQREVRFYYNSYSRIWRDIVQKYMKYTKPNIVNAHLKPQIDSKQCPLYVFPTFMRSGKQYYMIRHQGSKGRAQWYPSYCINKFREEEIPHYEKLVKRQVIIRQFHKETSVFSAWKSDDNMVLKKCLDHDFKFWKGSRFIRDKGERVALERTIKMHLPHLKAQHIYMISRSMYPSIFMNDFTTFSRKAKFLDKNLNQSTIDRLFIASNVELEDQEDNPDKALIRFELIELLVRIAKEKYQKTGICNTISEAFEKLLEVNVYPVSNIEEWQGFRDNQLYTVEVNDILFANLENLKKVYAMYHNSMQKWMTFDDALNLLCSRSDLSMSPKDATFCYGMSKMTCANENEDTQKKYMRLQFVELLELVGRVAEFKFKGSELEDLPLEKKIEHVLDDLFVVMPSLRRKQVYIQEEQHSESDSDY